MTLTVMGRRVEVKHVSQEEMKQLDKTQDLMGHFNPQDMTIHILSTLDKEISKRTLMHELFHAVLAISGLTAMLSDKQEEAVCNVIENLDGYFSL